MGWSLWMTTIVVDQVHEDVAVVEWENETLSVIDTIWLPTSIQEGDTLTVKLRWVPLSNCKLTSRHRKRTICRMVLCDGIDQLYLPLKPSWWDRVSVYWDIQYANEEFSVNAN